MQISVYNYIRIYNIYNIKILYITMQKQCGQTDRQTDRETDS